MSLLSRRLLLVSVVLAAGLYVGRHATSYAEHLVNPRPVTSIPVDLPVR